MSRILTSPSKKWPGTVTLQEPLTFPGYLAWKNALDAADEARQDQKGPMTLGEAAIVPEVTSALLPGLCACVEKWELEGLGQLTPDSFPATPRMASARLLLWLMGEIMRLVTEEEEVPNA
jgi:hypothetical protein